MSERKPSMFPPPPRPSGGQDWVVYLGVLALLAAIVLWPLAVLWALAAMIAG